MSKKLTSKSLNKKSDKILDKKSSKSLNEKPSKPLNEEKSKQKTLDKKKTKKTKENVIPESKKVSSVLKTSIAEKKEKHGEFFSHQSYLKMYEMYGLQAMSPFNYTNDDTFKTEIIVNPAYRKTSEIMTDYEFTAVVADRAKHLSDGAKAYVDVGDEGDFTKIAIMEIKNKVSPMSVVRYSNDMLFKEVWEVNEMIIPKK